MINSRKSKSQNVVPFSQSVADLKMSKSGNALDQIHHDISLVHGGIKRQGDNMVDPNQKRRAAFGDITNALNENKPKKQMELKKSRIPGKTVPLKPSDKDGKMKKADKKKLKETKQKVEHVRKDTMSEGEEAELSDEVVQLSQGSHMSSSQESVTDSEKDLNTSEEPESDKDLNATFTISLEDEPPKDVDNVDKENLHDIAQVAFYASDIFTYYKERELKFMVPMYMDKQKYLTSNMRAILVDWLVEVQENFELNHETLYLAVKLVDTYLSIKVVSKELLQLVGAASLFISCKFDERCPPLVEDFLYICDDAYKRREFLEMERNILKTVGFDIGMPLSYRFLRRYSKCARASMETLTLARYILEMSLMEYEFIKYRESKMAASCLYLAMKMKNSGQWTKTMVYYTGYKQEDLTSLAAELNGMIASPPKQLTTIHSKYSHKVFYEVAKTKALSEEELERS